MTARERAVFLSRGRPVSPPLLCPLVVTQAAEIGAVPVEDFLHDPTKLANGLQALCEAMELEAISTWDGNPTILEDQGLAEASVEATRRLVATVPEAAVAAALPGPSGGDDLLPLIRSFLDAGAHLVLLIERDQITDPERWRSSVTTITNVTRFHQAAPVAVLAEGSDARWVPGGTIVAVPDPELSQGLALPQDPSGWQLPDDPGPIITTLGPAGGGFSEVMQAVRRLSS